MLLENLKTLFGRSVCGSNRMGHKSRQMTAGVNRDSTALDCTVNTCFFGDRKAWNEFLQNVFFVIILTRYWESSKSI